MNRIFDRPDPGGRGLSALHGAAQLLGLGGTMARYRGRFAQGPRGDLLALQYDWARASRPRGANIGKRRNREPQPEVDRGQTHAGGRVRRSHARN